MTTRAFGLLLVGLALGSPAWAKKPKPAQSGSAEIVEPPPALKAAVTDASARGQAIWELDQASAINSDRVVPWLRIDARLSGPFVTTREGPRFTTVWSGLIDGVRMGLYSATIDIAAGKETQNVPFAADAAHLPPPFPLTEDQLARHRALEAAAKAPIERLSASYNSVVLPSDTGHTVYLIASTTDPNVMLIGGLVRVDVAADGAVMSVRPLSKTILRLPRPGTGDVPADATVLPLVTELGDHPTEGHVFASRTYGVPLLVACPATTWHVQNEQITMVRLPG